MGGTGAAASTARAVPGRVPAVDILVVLLIVASCGCRCGGQRCHDEERRALLELKRSINSPGGTALADWGLAGSGEEEDCCHWSGITCSSHTGRVVGIYLSYARTIEHGWYPNFTTFVQFRELETLSLEGNRMSGTIPNALCSLKQLKELYLVESTSLEGPIPQCLCNLLSLTGLHLSGNSLNGSIPSCLGNLHRLETFQLIENKISGTIPDGLCNLKRLKVLDFGQNLLGGPIPECLCSMHSLTRLDLSSNRLHGGIPSCLGALHSLEWLDLLNNGLEGSIPPSIFPNLTKLTHVGIGGHGLAGTFAFSVLANLSNLEWVEISSEYGLEIETESPSSWVPSFQLSNLNITRCVVNKCSGGRFPAGLISTQRRLDSLTLHDVSITGSLPLGVLCNSSLGDLTLRRNMLHGTFRLPCRNASHSLVAIDLSHNHVHGSLPGDVVFSIPNLQFLAMAGNELRGSIPPSLGQAPLAVLDLSDNNLSGKLPQALARNQTTLHYLNVSHNQLDGEMLPRDAYLPSLEFLYLQHNRFTGSIPTVLSNSSLLEVLDVGHNDLTCSLSHCLPSFPRALALFLRNNRLEGHLPGRLCHMQRLHILDVSGNDLTGRIPPCLSNISLWKSSSQEVTYDDELPISSYREDVMHFTSKSLLNAYQGIPLTKMTGLDVSSNRLSGVIPWEIGELKGLHTLNLSNNRLQGFLPPPIGNMESLESLDLSRNNLSGTIPHEMIKLHFLSVFSVSLQQLYLV